MQHPTADATPFTTLALAELEEAGGELVRRIAVALRALGETEADRVSASEGAEGAPRWRVARLAALIELAAGDLVGTEGAAEVPPGPDVVDAPMRARVAAASEATSLATGLMYAAPSIEALLTRLEQDRRLLASLARAAEHRLDERQPTPPGALAIRTRVAEVALLEPARCAQTLERTLAARSGPATAGPETVQL